MRKRKRVNRSGKTRKSWGIDDRKTILEPYRIARFLMENKADIEKHKADARKVDYALLREYFKKGDDINVLDPKAAAYGYLVKKNPDFCTTFVKNSKAFNDAITKCKKKYAELKAAGKKTGGGRFKVNEELYDLMAACFDSSLELKGKALVDLVSPEFVAAVDTSGTSDDEEDDDSGAGSSSAASPESDGAASSGASSSSRKSRKSRKSSKSSSKSTKKDMAEALLTHLQRNSVQLFSALKANEKNIAETQGMLKELIQQNALQGMAGMGAMGFGMGGMGFGMGMAGMGYNGMTSLPGLPGLQGLPGQPTAMGAGAGSGSSSSSGAAST